VPLNAPKPVIAIKFINKQHAFSSGKLRPKQIQMEVSLHSHLGRHKNIIQFLSAGDDALYVWIAMELADGGDLFDKIEPDIGVPSEDIAHFYFTQLMSAIGYMHSKGVAHRDLKPENMLVSGEGNLKIADFGLAALFERKGETKTSRTVCGSPPYIAPEIVASKHKRPDQTDVGYMPNIADIWSCGVVLFVLLVGNTPWDEPTMSSEEFREFVEKDGRSQDELWERIPADIVSLLRGMLKLDPATRFSLDEVRRHPWFTRENPHLSSTGTAKDPILLATQMMENLRVDLHADPALSQQRRGVCKGVDYGSMDIDQPHQLASTQPETPLAEIQFDWERMNIAEKTNFSASQPTTSRTFHTRISPRLLDQLSEDPSLSQFQQTPSVPLSLTQAAKKFGDIVPAHSITHFYSDFPLPLLVKSLLEGLHRLGVPSTAVWGDGEAYIRVRTVDGRNQRLNGTLIMECCNDEICEARFVKINGDPLEWRRFYKKMCVLCKEAVVVPNQ
jgi:serine/threonine-protein kinase Chk1